MHALQIQIHQRYWLDSARFQTDFLWVKLLRLVYRTYASTKANSLPDWSSWTVEWIFHYIFNIQVVDVLQWVPQITGSRMGNQDNLKTKKLSINAHNNELQINLPYSCKDPNFRHLVTSFSKQKQFWNSSFTWLFPKVQL